MWSLKVFVGTSSGVLYREVSFPISVVESRRIPVSIVLEDFISHLHNYVTDQYKLATRFFLEFGEPLNMCRSFIILYVSILTNQPTI